MLNTLVIRCAAVGILASGGVLYAMETGVIGSSETDDATAGEQTLTSDSRAAQPHRLAPEFAQIVTGSDVRLPVAMDPVAPEAMVVPASFEAPEETPNLTTPTGLSYLGLPCEIAVTATAMPAAIVALDVMAPCRAGTSVQITHSDLVLDAETDTVGFLAIDIPAFEANANFTVTFDDGITHTASVAVPDLEDFDRIGLMWDGDLGLELHAMEFGATFGEPGHVWHEHPAQVDAAVSGEGGFLSQIALGDTYAQVYTLPRATLQEGESVRLSIDAPVTAQNCEAHIRARTLRAEAAGPVDTTDLSFTVPGCDAIGDILVLQNLLADLRLASN
ncbi:hypothetical protein [Gymnodinialimonas ulvae]|uniref:hypothetical protein n=1 Tax=Gymnodinialimonas ulvae TaxID=3126504 RepID=UPI0030A5FEC5